MALVNGTMLPSGLIPDDAHPDWLNTADNAWQLTAAAMVGLQSVPGLVILYGSMVKKKWAVNSSFMALYAFAAVLICWVLWGHRMSFGSDLGRGGIVGEPHHAVAEKFLLSQYEEYFLPNADYVLYQFAFAAITVILLAGSLLGRMNFYAWILFVPLWLTFSYTIGAHTIWGSGFLAKIGIIDFSGGYVIHLSSGVAGFTAAYWVLLFYPLFFFFDSTQLVLPDAGLEHTRSSVYFVPVFQVGPRSADDRQHFPPNNIIHVLGGAGFLWMGWSGFNGGSSLAANLITSLAVLNTHLCTATSVLVWLSMDMIYYKKSSVIGAVQGMITGLVCITPAAGIVDTWAAVLMGSLSGLIPWYTMMVLHKKSAFFQKVDDTLGVFHTHAVAGTLGGLLSGIFAKPNLLRMYGTKADISYGSGLLYGLIEGKTMEGLYQLLKQLGGAAFITVWNAVITSLICILVNRVVSLRMDEEDLEKGDDAVHGEEAYALWGDGERHPPPLRFNMTPKIPSFFRRH